MTPQTQFTPQNGVVATVARTNALGQAINDMRPPLTGGPGDDGPRSREPLVGLIWGSGPDLGSGAQADRTGADYWVRRCYVKMTNDADSRDVLIVSEASERVGPEDWCVATNLAERPANTGGTEGTGTHLLKVGTAVIYWPVTDLDGGVRYAFNRAPGLTALKGTVSAIGDCDGTATVSYTPPGGSAESWTVYLNYPDVSTYNKGVGAGSDILFLPFGDPADKTGVAVGAEKDYVGLLVDDVEYIRKIRNVYVVNKHGPGDRPDFNDANLALLTGMECPDQVDLGLNWNASDVLSYPDTLKQIRVFDFDGADQNPSLPDSYACVRFSTFKPVGDAGDDSGVVAKISGIVPLVIVDASDENLQIDGGDSSGGCVTVSPTLKHIGPGAQASIYTPLGTPVVGSSDLTLPVFDLPLDGTGHGKTPVAGTPITIPFTELNVVSDVNCVEGVIVPVITTIKFIGSVVS